MPNPTKVEQIHHARERGNVVAVTLLVLAVAILIGIGALFVIGSQPTAPTATPTPPTDQPTAPESQKEEQASDTVDPYASWNELKSEAFAVQFKYPPGWIVEANPASDFPVLTAYDARQTQNAPNATSGISSVHELDTRISFYPKGMPTPLPQDERARSTVILQVPRATERDLVLGGTARPWATYATFTDAPTPWTPAGTLFARTAIEEEELAFFRNETEIVAEEYSPTNGDTFVRYGFTDPSERTTIEEILATVRFYTPKTEGGTTDGAPEEESGTTIRILAPTPNTNIVSPLSVEGELTGTIPEAGIEIALTDESGTELARIPAELVVVSDEPEAATPFALSLIFASTSATSGSMQVFVGNSSDAVVTVPVSL